MTTDTKLEDAVLFAILTEMLCQHVNLMEGQYRHNSKRMVNNLLCHAKTTLAELKRSWPSEANETLEQLYDFFYMSFRELAKVESPDVSAFENHIKQFTNKYSSNGK